MRLPPGPSSPIPLLGDLPLIGLGKAVGLGPQPHRRMTELAAEYGDVMSLRMGEEGWVVLSSPEAVHEAFVARGSDFAGRPMVPSMRLSSGGGKGFARPQMTPELRKLRQTATASLFSAAQVHHSQTSLEQEAHRLGEHLIAQSAVDGDVAIRPALRRAVSNMVLRYAFSSSVPYEAPLRAERTAAAPTVDALVAVVEEIWSLLTATPTTAIDLLTRSDPTLALSTIAYRQLDSLVAERDALLTTLIQERKATRRRHKHSDESAAGDMLDVLLDAGLPDDDVHYTLVDMFVAGTNTVSTALEWMLLLLADSPLEQERARARRGDGTYLDALLCEVLRYKPPLLLPRTATRDTAVGGFVVPRGTVVLANNHALTSSALWWHEPSVFYPSRFLEEESHLKLRGASGGSADACKFVPFSVGQRVCPGSRLAIAELQAAASVLLRTTRWRRAAPATSVDLREEYGLTLAPQMAQRLRFERVAPRAAARARRPRSTAVAIMATRTGVDEEEPRAGGSGRGAAARSTRRQNARSFEEVGDADRLKEVGTDRRRDWRASKAKANRRNRRYERRLLSSVAGDNVDIEE